jgi:hypothetical protein
MRKRSFTPTLLIYTGLFFLAVGVIEIIMGIKNTNSTVLGTIYITTAIIVSAIEAYSLPLQITNNIKPEVIDLLEWSNNNIPNSDHPDLCAEFVKEFRKRYNTAIQTDNQK